MSQSWPSSFQAPTVEAKNGTCHSIIQQGIPGAAVLARSELGRTAIGLFLEVLARRTNVISSQGRHVGMCRQIDRLEKRRACDTGGGDNSLKKIRGRPQGSIELNRRKAQLLTRRARAPRLFCQEQDPRKHFGRLDKKCFELHLNRGWMGMPTIPNNYEVMCVRGTEDLVLATGAQLNLK